MSAPTLLEQPAPKTETGIVLRSASPADAALIHDLTQAAYLEYETSGEPSSVTQERADDLRASLAAGTASAIIVEWNGQPVGSVRYRFEDDGAALYFFRLGVLPIARGLGIARMMVAALETEAVCHGVSRLCCCVRLNVARNVSLYESSGFRPVGEPWIVRRGENDVPTGRMEKITSPPDPLSEAERGGL